MPGLLDMFGGGGGSDLFGDLLTEQQKQAMAQRGLLGFLGGMQKSGALDYTVPFISGKVPGGFAAGLAGGMAGMGEARDAAGMNALKAMLLGSQAKQAQEQSAVVKSLMKALGLGDLGGGAAAPMANPLAAQTPGIGAAPAAALQGPLAPQDTVVPPAVAGGLQAGGAGGLLSPFAMGNAVAGGPSSVEGVLPEFASRINTMAQAMPSEIRNKFGIISGFRSPERQAGVNPGVTNSHHTAAGAGTGIAVDTVTDPDVINWINKNGRLYGVDYTLRHMPGEENHLEMLGPSGGRIAPNQMADVVARYRNQSGGPVQLAQYGGGATSPAQAAGIASQLAGALSGPLAAPPAAAPAGGPLAQVGQQMPAMASPSPAAPSGGAGGPMMLGNVPITPENALKLGILGDLVKIPSIGPLLTGTPQYKGQVAGEEERQKRLQGLPFIGPETTAKTGAERAITEPSDIRIMGATQQAMGARERANEQFKASLDMVPVRVQGANGPEIRMVRRSDYAAAAPGMTAGGNGNLVPGGAIPGQAAQAPAAVPGAAGMPPVGSIVGEPAGLGATPEGYRAVQTPSGMRYEKVPGGPAATAETQRNEAKRQSGDIVLENIDRSLTLSSGWTTGMAGALFRAMPGTDAHNLSTNLDTIKANIQFDQLQTMRQGSPTGAALGNVTEGEGKLLQSTLGSLEQSQSKEQFDQNLRRLRSIYLDVVHGTPEKLDEAMRQGKITAAQRDASLAQRESNKPATTAAAPIVKQLNGKSYFSPDNGKTWYAP